MGNPTYTATDVRLGHVSYRDRKRWLWALSVVYPLIPFTGIGAHAWTGQPLWLLLPLAIGYLGGPLLDAWLGEDRNNPPEAVVPQLEADRYYRRLTYAVVPLHYLALIGCAVWAGTQALPWWAFRALAYVAGTTSGLGINTGHELGHKHTALEVWLAKLVLAVPAYGHFRVEHNRGHHASVATPEDHASARMGESIYRFALRELPGGMKRAWALEGERLKREGRSAWSPHNELLHSYAITLALQGTLIALYGGKMVAFLAIHNLVAWWQLTSANYVEHYGLLRAERARRALRALPAPPLMERQPHLHQPGAVPAGKTQRPPRQRRAPLPEPAPLPRPAATAQRLFRHVPVGLCAAAVVQGDGPAAAGPAAHPGRLQPHQPRPEAPRNAAGALRRGGLGRPVARHATLQRAQLAALQRPEQTMVHIALAKLIDKAVAHIVLDLQQQVGRHLGIGQRTVGAPGAGQVVQRRQRAQPVVGRVRVQPARQQHGAGKLCAGSSSRPARCASERQKPRSKAALCATSGRPRVKRQTSRITCAAGGASRSMALLMPVSCSMKGLTQAPLCIRLA